MDANKMPQNLALGLLSVQRLHREALSAHGDVYQLGARAALRPYSTTDEDAERFFRAVNFPVPGQATADDRGGYPVRSGDRTMMFTPDELRNAETETQGWIQFETAEYIMDRSLRDRVLDLMVEQGRNKACGFVGPFDAILREGEIPEINDAVNELFREAAKRGLHMGRVVGSGSMEDPKDIEDAMVEAIENGARLISCIPHDERYNLSRRSRYGRTVFCCGRALRLLRRMKIAGIKTPHVGQFPNSLFLRIHTNSGTVGRGGKLCAPRPTTAFTSGVYMIKQAAVSVPVYFCPLLRCSEPRGRCRRTPSRFHRRDLCPRPASELRSVFRPSKPKGL